MMSRQQGREKWVCQRCVDRYAGLPDGTWRRTPEDRLRVFGRMFADTPEPEMADDASFSIRDPESPPPPSFAPGEEVGSDGDSDGEEDVWH